MAMSSERLRQVLLANLGNRPTPRTIGGALADLGGSIATGFQLAREVPRLRAEEEAAEAKATADRIGQEVALRDALIGSGVDPAMAGGIAGAEGPVQTALLNRLPKPEQPPSELDVARFQLDVEELQEKRLSRKQRAEESRAARVPSVIRTVEALGIDPQSNEGREIITQTLTKPQVQIGPGKAPTGFRFKDRTDPLSELEPVPGGPADRMTPEQAAKTQMVAQGVADLDSARKILFDEDGNLNRSVIAQSNIPGLGGAVPGTQGVLLRSLLWNAVNAQLRAESGAAVPEPEVDRAVERFLPSPFDTPETAKAKIDRLQGLLSGTLQASGRTPAPTVATEPPAAEETLSTGALEAAEPAAPTTQEEFDALPSGAVFRDPGDGQLYRKP